MSADSESAEVRVLLCGDSKSGKTCFSRRVGDLTSAAISMTTTPTVEEVSTCPFAVAAKDDDVLCSGRQRKTFSLKITEAGGDVKFFPTLHEYSVTQASCFLLLYDASVGIESWKAAWSVFEHLVDSRGFGVPCVVFGNKEDLKGSQPVEEFWARLVAKKRADSRVRPLDTIRFFTGSAKTGQSVHAAVVALLRLQHDHPLDPDAVATLGVAEPGKGAKSAAAKKAKPGKKKAAGKFCFSPRGGDLEDDMSIFKTGPGDT